MSILRETKVNLKNHCDAIYLKESFA